MVYRVGLGNENTGYRAVQLWQTKYFSTSTLGLGERGLPGRRDRMETTNHNETFSADLERIAVCQTFGHTPQNKEIPVGCTRSLPLRRRANGVSFVVFLLVATLFGAVGAFAKPPEFVLPPEVGDTKVSLLGAIGSIVTVFANGTGVTALEVAPGKFEISTAAPVAGGDIFWAVSNGERSLIHTVPKPLASPGQSVLTLDDPIVVGATNVGGCFYCNHSWFNFSQGLDKVFAYPPEGSGKVADQVTELVGQSGSKFWDNEQATIAVHRNGEAGTWSLMVALSSPTSTKTGNKQTVFNIKSDTKPTVAPTVITQQPAQTVTTNQTAVTMKWTKYAAMAFGPYDMDECVSIDVDPALKVQLTNGVAIAHGMNTGAFVRVSLSDLSTIKVCPNPCYTSTVELNVFKVGNTTQKLPVVELVKFLGVATDGCPAPKVMPATVVRWDVSTGPAPLAKTESLCLDVYHPTYKKKPLGQVTPDCELGIVPVKDVAPTPLVTSAISTAGIVTVDGGFIPGSQIDAGTEVCVGTNLVNAGPPSAVCTNDKWVAAIGGLWTAKLPNPPANSVVWAIARNAQQGYANSPWAGPFDIEYVITSEKTAKPVVVTPVAGSNSVKVNLFVENSSNSDIKVTLAKAGGGVAVAYGTCKTAPVLGGSSCSVTGSVLGVGDEVCATATSAGLTESDPACALVQPTTKSKTPDALGDPFSPSYPDMCDGDTLIGVNTSENNTTVYVYINSGVSAVIDKFVPNSGLDTIGLPAGKTLSCGVAEGFPPDDVWVTAQANGKDMSAESAHKTVKCKSDAVIFDPLYQGVIIITGTSSEPVGSEIWLRIDNDPTQTFTTTLFAAPNGGAAFAIGPLPAPLVLGQEVAVRVRAPGECWSPLTLADIGICIPEPIEECSEAELPPGGDADCDLEPNMTDNCACVANPEQTDLNENGIGDECECIPLSAAQCDPLTLDPGGDADCDGVLNEDDNCPCVSNPDQSDEDNNGWGDACPCRPLPLAVCEGSAQPPNGDADCDGVLNRIDNCECVANQNQTDDNNNGIGDSCECIPVDPNECDSTDPLGDPDCDGIPSSRDNCGCVPNPDQTDENGNGIGDVCESCEPMPLDECLDTELPLTGDADCDGIPNGRDLCPCVANDGSACLCVPVTLELCDPTNLPKFGDADCDGVLNQDDNCACIPNTDQTNSGGSGAGDACEPCDIKTLPAAGDWDGDGYANAVDTCPCASNPTQDYIDICDAPNVPCEELDLPDNGDFDGDGLSNGEDNCKCVSNADQADGDDDGVGDVCDNCAELANPDQLDDNDNDIGDACDCTLPLPDGTCDETCKEPGQDTDEDGLLDEDDNCFCVANPDQLDIDDDGIGDACDADITGQLAGGGGCVTTPPESPTHSLPVGFWLLLVASACGIWSWRRGRSIKMILLVLLLNAALVVPSAKAETFDAQFYNPATGTRNLLVTFGADPGYHLDYSIGFQVAYARNPLVLKLGDNEDPVLKDLVTGYLGMSLSLLDFMQFALTVPVNLYVGGEFDAKDLSKLTMGDILLHAKITLVHPDWTNGFGLALVPTVIFPTGNADNFTGSGDFGTILRLALDYRIEGVVAAINLGYAIKAANSVRNVTVGDEMTFSAGLGYWFVEEFGTTLEVKGSTLAEDPFGDPTEGPTELFLGIDGQPVSGLHLLAAAGVGLTEGVGSPDFHIIGGLNWAPEVRDTDGDGCYDDVDPCPLEPEDFDGFQDDDCCPDPDNDQDGILDINDECPNDPEDKDGFEDLDGCPDPDNDKDGILDVVDKCPNVPEDKDGCSDEDGCPDADNDRDGIPDAEDKCPDHPEVFNGFRDDDGCPDTVAFELKEDRAIMQADVLFDTDKATLKPEGQEVISQMAGFLIKYTNLKLVRVAGHADFRGSDKYNMKLSAERAKTVLDALVTLGVEAARLESMGYGETVPKVVIEKPKKLSKQELDDALRPNRRVEFEFVKMDPFPANVTTGPVSTEKICRP